jgi:hypothetical protein
MKLMMQDYRDWYTQHRLSPLADTAAVHSSI